MPFTFGFFHDSALTTPINASSKLVATQNSEGTLPATDTIIYFGSAATARKVRDAASPGVAQIFVSIADSATGSGAPATEFKLALSSGGLSSAAAGALLQIGTTILSGVSNAVPIYTRRTSALTTVGVYTDITLTTQSLLETPV